jgi:phosphotransferase system enzyme I (PtsI)
MTTRAETTPTPSSDPATAAGTVLRGAGVGRRTAVGPVVRVQPAPVVPGDAPVVRDGAPVPADAVPDAVVAAFGDVAAGLRDQAGRSTGTVAEVLGATAMMADDPALRDQVLGRVRGGEPAVAAIDAVVGTFAAMFEQAGGYLAERVTDLRSVRDRVIARLAGLPAPGVPELREPSVVVARDLAPADTAALDLGRVLALVTEEGGPTGHTAIIAGQNGIPCVVRVTGAAALADGVQVAVDAAAGTVTVEPDVALRSAFEARAAAELALESDTAPGATADGHRVALLANIGTAEDAERLVDAPVEGVGLFRTEVLFLGRQQAPTVDEQATAYARVLRALGPDRKVVVRTLDAGADKPLAFANLTAEENPALGVRGYRLVRSAPDLLADQLAALARAGQETGTEPWVMAPMIATPAEARAFAEAVRAAGLRTPGVMVEVPAAALRAGAVLDEVDFVSLGTNDLAQYTMAADRLRGELVDLLDPWQPAVLDLVAATARAGGEHGRPVGVCGESASDPLMALVLTGLGVTSLSMSPAALPAVRFALRRHTLAHCHAMADAALGAADPAAGRAAVADLLDAEARATLGV